MSLERAIDRTILLMRDHLRPDTPRDVMMEALCTTKVVIAGDSRNLTSNSAQSAVVAAASLVVRSGGIVYLDLPRASLLRPQPPLRLRELCAGLVELGRDILPGRRAIRLMQPDHEVELAVILGDSEWRGRARHAIRLNAGPWTAVMQSSDGARRWASVDWPLGGLGAGAFAASEAFKAAMRKLSVFGCSPVFGETFAPSVSARFDFAPVDTPCISDLGKMDVISAGAICHAILFILSRLPGIAADLRVIDGDVTEDSNLNRYLLLRLSELEIPKVLQLASIGLKGIRLQPEGRAFDANTAHELRPLARRVSVGVDHIPTRWAVQKEDPEWLCVGATSHYSAMASFHTTGLPCAGCLHPRDDIQDGPIPTAAFVSFWAGLMASALLLRNLSGEQIPSAQQHTYFTPLRPENEPWIGQVGARMDCPVHCELARQPR